MAGGPATEGGCTGIPPIAGTARGSLWCCIALWPPMAGAAGYCRQRRSLWNDATIGYLAQLVQDGTLENIQEGHPRGYRPPGGEE